MCENLHHPFADVGHEDRINSPLHNKRARGATECIRFRMLAAVASVSIYVRSNGILRINIVFVFLFLNMFSIITCLEDHVT